MSLQELADKIRERLNYYLNDELEAKCYGVDIEEASNIVIEFKEELDKLLSSFWGNGGADMRTKVQIQKDTFLTQLNRYNNEVHTSIGF